MPAVRTRHARTQARLLPTPAGSNHRIPARPPHELSGRRRSARKARKPVRGSRSACLAARGVVRQARRFAKVEGNEDQRRAAARQARREARIPRGEGGSHPSGQAGLAKDTEAGRGTWQGPPCVSICLEAPARRPHERFWQEPSGRNWHSHLQSSASPAACAVRARVYDTTVQREPRSQLGPRRESAPDQVAAALSTLSGATPGIPGWVGQPGVPVGR